MRAVVAAACAAVVVGLAAAAAAQTPPWPAGVLVPTPLPAHYQATLCGSRLLPCPPGTLGRGSAMEPKAHTVGDFVEVDLQRFFDSPEGAEAAVPLGGPPPRYTPEGWGAPGINGTPYIEQDFPSTGDWTVLIHGLPVTFLIPALGVGIRSTFDLAAPVTIPVPPGRYRAVWLLGTGIGGGAGEVLLEATYQGGVVRPYTFDFTEWCTPGQLAPGEFPAAVMPELQAASGSGSSARMVPAYPGCGGLYAYAVPLDPMRVLESLSIPGSVVALLGGREGGAQNDFLVAVSLQR
jgi:hypothetical protein